MRVSSRLIFALCWRYFHFVYPFPFFHDIHSTIHCGSKSMGVNCSILPFNATVLCHHLVMSFDFGIKKMFRKPLLVQIKLC